MYLVGDAYSNGRGVPKDHAWAARWYGKAAAQGVGRAQYMLGVAFGAGLGLPREPVNAYPWLILASEQDVGEATKLRDAVKSMLPAAEQRAGERQARSWQPETVTRTWDQPTLRFVQYSLDTLGYRPGPVDGVLGPKTKKALLAYQKDRRLSQQAALTAKLLGRLRQERLTVADK